MSKLSRIAERLASTSDQAIFSATSFLSTLLISHRYSAEELAGYGMGIALGLALGGSYRTSYVVPLALSSDSEFARSVTIQSSRHMAVYALLLSLVLLFVPLIYVNSAYTSVIFGIMANCSTYLSVDHDRVLCYRRLGYKRAWGFSVLTSLALLSILGLDLLVGLNFVLLCILFSAVSAVRTFIVSVFIGGGRLSELGEGLKAALGVRASWGAIGTLSSAGYGQIPAWTLAYLCSPINVASFSISRTLTQPLQIIMRSLDVIDKLMMGRLREASEEVRQKFIRRTYALYCAICLFFVSLMAIFAEYLVTLIFSSQYAHTHTTLRWWCVVIFFVSTSAALETKIYSEGHHKQYALFQVLGGGVSILASIPLAIYFQENGAVTSCVLGWLIPYSWLLLMNFKHA